MKTKEQELQEELNRIKGLVQNVEGKIEALKLEKEDKFAELKEAYKNGAVIECLQTTGNWFEIENPMWQTEFEYRIKPEEQSTVILYLKIKGRHCLREFPINQKNNLMCNGWKVLTQQEAIELLFGSED